MNEYRAELQQLLPVFEKQQWTSASLPEIHRKTVEAMMAFENGQRTTALAISKQILLLDMKPDTWRRLQFAHISLFPIIDW